MIQLDFKSGVSICDQIVNGFIKLKAFGVMVSDEQLPSVRALASKLSVNPNTVQKAYAILEANGIIYSVKGKGSFISGDEKASAAVMLAARKEFISAIKAANDLGLTTDELITLVKNHSNQKEDTLK